MFRKILFPTDFSEHSKKALEYVKKLKEAGTKEVVVLHVIDEAYVEAYEDAFAWAGKDVEVEAEKISEKLVSEAEGKIEPIKEELKAGGLIVKVVVTIGKPYEEIIKTAYEENASVIVIGSHGCGSISCKIERMIGSTAENVVEHSSIPVFVVK